MLTVEALVQSVTLIISFTETSLKSSWCWSSCVEGAPKPWIPALVNTCLIHFAMVYDISALCSLCNEKKQKSNISSSLVLSIYASTYNRFLTRFIRFRSFSKYVKNKHNFYRTKRHQILIQWCNWCPLSAETRTTYIASLYVKSFSHCLVMIYYTSGQLKHPKLYSTLV